MRRTLTPTLLALAALASAAGGCPGPEDDLASEAADSVENTVSESALLAAATDGMVASLPPLAAAALAARRATVAFRPPHCVTASAVGPTVTYTLRGCQSVLGLEQVRGTLQVTFGARDGALTAQLRSQRLLVEGASLDLDVDASLRVEALMGRPTATLEVRSQTAARGFRGARVDRSGTYRVTSTREDETRCIAFEGRWTTRAATRTATTTVRGLNKCSARCPQPGGVITHTVSSPAQTLTIEFTGGTLATWSLAPDGRSGTVPLSCVP